MINSKIILAIFFLISYTPGFSKDYYASFFGIESNGITLNTSSIQKAIDYIHEEGGGRLVFHVGKYHTGTIYLKSNVTIHLKEGAVILGSENPFDYIHHGYWSALIIALDQENIGITGKGMIDGRGYQLSQNVISMIHKGIIKNDALVNDRPKEGNRPQNLLFRKCKNIKIQGITFKNPASWNQQYNQCKNLIVENITVDSKNYWNNDGIDILDCDSVIIRNSFFDTADDAICIKSESKKTICQNVLIYNNKIRSSANGIKFGTFSYGGFKNIKIKNNIVYDTYRSAITFASVDGAEIENIIVDSLVAINTGNAIFLRIGERREGRKGSMKNVSISNLQIEIAEKKSDLNYPYEGPIEHQPRNISPAIITGLPNAKIENLILKNISINYPGGANPFYAKIDLSDLDKIPELKDKYPEFSMFKELPAWGFYIRHATNIQMENVTITSIKKDFRVPIVLDDVQNVIFKNLKVNTPDKQKKLVHQHNSQDIKFEK